MGHVRYRSVHRDLVDGIHDPAASTGADPGGSGPDRRGHPRGGPRTSPPKKESAVDDRCVDRALGDHRGDHPVGLVHRGGCGAVAPRGADTNWWNKWVKVAAPRIGITKFSSGTDRG